MYQTLHTKVHSSFHYFIKIPVLVLISVFLYQPINASTQYVNCDLIAADTLYSSELDCNAPYTICFNQPLSDFDHIIAWSDGVDITNTFSGCTYDTLYNYSYSLLSFPGGPYQLTDWIVGQDTFNITFTTPAEFVDSLNTLGIGTWTDISASALIRGGMNGFSFPEMEIVNLSNMSSLSLFPSINISPENSLLSFGSGDHVLVLEDTMNLCSDTIHIVSQCIPCHTPFFGPDMTVQVSSCDISHSICTTIPTSESSFYTLTINGVQEPISESCMGGSVPSSLVAISVDTGSYQIVLSDTRIDCADTLNIQVNCPPPVLDCSTLFPELFSEVNLANCGDYEYCIPLTVDEINSTYTLILNDDKYSDLITACPGSGSGSTILLPVGINDLIITDRDACSDTTQIIVSCIQPETITDTLLIGESELFCPTDNELPSTGSGYVVACPSSNPDVMTITHDPSTDCFSIEAGTQVGNAQACVAVCDTLGYCDTTYFQLYIQEPILTTETITDTLDLNSSLVYCADESELPSTGSGYVVTCPSNFPDIMTVTHDATTNCFEIETGNQPGDAQACITVCDVLGYCDTTYLQIHVPESMDQEAGPIAVPDTSITNQGITTLIPILANDTINGSIMRLEIVNQTGGGFAQITLDQQILFTPNEDFCAPEGIQLSYELCNDYACDTTEVVIATECIDQAFKVFGGFSPNGDGVNEFFTIAGLDDFPDHELYIYNRWGQQVYRVKEYQNDWQGNWNGTALPNGVYFYILEDGTGGVQSGHFSLQR